MFSERYTLIRCKRTLARGVNLNAMGMTLFRGNAFPDIRIS